MKRLFITFAVILGASLLAGLCLLTQPLLLSPPTSDPPPVDPQRLEAHVRMLSETFYPRSFEQADKLNAAAAYIRQELQRSGAVESRIFEAEGEKYSNIVARFGPDDGPVLIIGAHYDSHGDTTRGTTHAAGYGPDTHTPGADDNASGVAGLLELARLFKAHPPAIGVELVAYSLEEPPYFRTENMGSAVHAKELSASGRAVRGMISLEMIGYFDTAAGSQRYPLQLLEWIYPDRGDYIGVVGSLADGLFARKIKAAMRGATDLPVHSINAPAAIPGIDFSDHLNYWREGFAAVMITDTAFYRNTQYHQAGDTADRLDYPRMAKVVQGVFETVRRLGDAS